MPSRRAAIVVLPLLLFALEANAQEGPYSNFLIGERSLGLAGAFVAVADDPSATFHNPGGIGTLSTGAISGSLWAVSFSSRHVQDGYTTELGSMDLEYDEVPSLPLFIAGVVKFGARERDGVRPHAIGAALFSPRSGDYKYIVQLDSPTAAVPPAVDRLEVRHGDAARWYGLSYAYRLQRPRRGRASQPGLSLGVSTFLAIRSVLHEEVELHAVQADAASLPPDAVYARDSITKATARHGVLRLGALLDLGDHIRLGAMFQPPGLRLGGTGRVSELTSMASMSGTEFMSARVEGLDTNLPMPWELRLGASWISSETALVTADVSLFGPEGDASDPLPLLERAPTDPFPGVFVPERSYRHAAFRGAVGFEIFLFDVIPIRGGLLAELSSSPDLPLTSASFIRQDVDTLGAALSIGVKSGGWDLSVGATAIFGDGRAMALQRAGSASALGYSATDISERTVFVFIGGGRHAVKTLVKEIYEDDEKRQKRFKQRRGRP